MDTKTLLITGLWMSFAISLGMLLVFWTRRTYPGFGHWVAAHLSRTLGVALLLLQPSPLPAWLTIIVANYLLLASFLFNVRGTMRFRGRALHYGWEVAVSVSFCALFAYFTYVVPSVNARIVVLSGYFFGLSLWLIRILLTRRPPYFGSADLWLTAAFTGWALVSLIRGIHTLSLGTPIADLMSATHIQSVSVPILFMLLSALLVALGQIIMNTQRLEYDYRLVQQSLEQDITARQKVEKALRESEEKFRLAFNNANNGMCLVDLDGRIIQVNRKMSDIFGYGPQQLETMTVNDLALPEDTAKSPEFIRHALQGKVDSGLFEKRYRHRQGHIIHAQIASALVRDAQGQPRYFISHVQDITEHKRMQETLRDQAIRDPLTGLFNRRYLDETLPRELQRCRRDGRPLAVSMLDIDHFKPLNDNHGHEVGDRVLQAVGTALQRFLRGSDVACRYGGEELTLILPGLSLEHARTRMEELRLILRQQHHDLPPITVSIGVAVTEPTQADGDTVLARADAALYEAKAQGRDRVVCSVG